jgi:hypothetical protein
MFVSKDPMHSKHSLAFAHFPSRVIDLLRVSYWCAFQVLATRQWSVLYVGFTVHRTKHGDRAIMVSLHGNMKVGASTRAIHI